MSARQKSTTAKKPRSYDPARIADGETVRVASYVSVNVTDEDGNETDVLVPKLPGRTDEDLKREAVEYARARRRISDAWREELSPDEVDAYVKPLAGFAAAIVVKNLVDVFADRASDDDVIALEGAADDVINASIERFQESLLESLREAEPANMVQEIRKEVIAGVLLDFEEREGPELADLEQAEYDARFDKVYEETIDVHTTNALSFYAQDIARIVLEDLKPADVDLDELREMIGGPANRQTTTSIGDLPSFPADRASEKLVRYVGGRERPVGRTKEGFDKLAAITRYGYELQHLEVRVDPAGISATHPDDVKPVLDRIKAERNETKAKTLLAAFAYASDPSTIDVSDFTVDLEELVELVSGYKRTGPKKTNRRYYHRKVAEILRYLHVDLASLQVNIRVVRRKKDGKEPNVVRGEYLMNRPRIESQQAVVYEEFYDELRRLIIASAALDDAKTDEERVEAEAARDAAVEYLDHVKPTFVVLGFPKDVADALALGSNQARERVSVGVLKSLKGPAFWLAYDLVFRRRWTRRKSLQKGDGTPLLDVLSDAGFLEESTKRSGGRASYKVALRAFFDAIDELLDLGELDHPGVEILRSHNGPGRPRNVTTDVKKWTTARGKHVREADLKPLTVRYVMLEERVEELQASREKSKPKRRKRPSAG